MTQKVNSDAPNLSAHQHVPRIEGRIQLIRGLRVMIDPRFSIRTLRLSSEARI
jgi:hypothetical protein